MVHFMGSDAHNDLRRNFCLREAISICENQLDFKTEILIKENPQKLLNGEKIIPFEIKDQIEENFFQKIRTFWNS